MTWQTMYLQKAVDDIHSWQQGIEKHLQMIDSHPLVLFIFLKATITIIPYPYLINSFESPHKIPLPYYIAPLHPV